MDYSSTFDAIVIALCDYWYIDEDVPECPLGDGGCTLDYRWQLPDGDLPDRAWNAAIKREFECTTKYRCPCGISRIGSYDAFRSLVKRGGKELKRLVDLYWDAHDGSEDELKQQRQAYNNLRAYVEKLIAKGENR